MPHPRTYAIHAYLAVFGGSFGAVALASALLGDTEGRLWWPLSRLGSSGMLKACGVTSLHVEGAERLEALRRSPAVVMANHESLFDPAVLMRSTPSPLRFVVKREVSRVPVFGRALSAMGHVFIDRGDSEEADRALDRAAKAISAGRTVLVFPEGTRAETDALLPFKRGGFRLAVRAGVPILPVGIAGTGRILPKRGGFQGRGDVALVVGEPVPTSGYGVRELDALIARVRNDVEALRGHARSLCRT
jgi:1-acyl-sn-glycerol-3-phosphate acyltransferase